VAKEKFRVVCPSCRPLEPVKGPPKSIQNELGRRETTQERIGRERLNKEISSEYYNVQLPMLIQKQEEDMKKFLDWQGTLVPISFFDSTC
jgi:hypothetical protein